MDSVIGRIAALLDGSKGRLNAIVYGLGDHCLNAGNFPENVFDCCCLFFEHFNCHGFRPSLRSQRIDQAPGANSVISM